MTSDLSGRRVFLASPGGLDKERQACRSVIANYNEIHAYEAGVAFIPTGWEDIAGTISRPQSEINKQLHEADFVVVLLGDRWGSRSAVDGVYSSGTEEEFFEAVTCLGDSTKPLRDILVLFKAISEDKLEDPGLEVSHVLAFRKKLEDSKAIFFKTFDSATELNYHLERKLQIWTKDLPPKNPVRLSISPPEGIPSNLTGQDQDLDGINTDQLLARAEEYAQQGLQIQAELAFLHARREKRPDAILKSARYMRRVGRLQRAIELNKEMLGLASVAASREPNIAAMRAEALANIGLLHRKLGDIRQSRVDLDEAITTARLAGVYGQKQLAYSLDNLGITLAGPHQLVQGLCE